MRAQKLATQLRQEQIAQAALNLIGSQGLQALNISTVAQAVGLVPSGIYRHFRSKDELLEATLELIREKMLENVALARESAPDALGQLKALLLRHLQLIMEHQAIPLLVFSEGIFADSEGRRAKVRSIISDYFSEIEKIVVQGQEEGIIKPDIEPLTVVLMFKGLVMPAVVLWRISGGELDLFEHAEAAWQLFVAAVGQEDNPNKGGRKNEDN